MGSFLYCVYALVHLHYLWAFYIAYRWEHLRPQAKPEIPWASFCLKWALITTAHLGLDLIGLMPIANARYSQYTLGPFILIKAGLLVLLLAQSDRKRT